MPANRILVFPGKAKLKVVAGNSFVHANRSRIHRSGAPEITEILRWFRHIANTVFIQARR